MHIKVHQDQKNIQTHWNPDLNASKEGEMVCHEERGLCTSAIAIARSRAQFLQNSSANALVEFTFPTIQRRSLATVSMIPKHNNLRAPPFLPWVARNALIHRTQVCGGALGGAFIDARLPCCYNFRIRWNLSLEKAIGSNRWCFPQPYLNSRLYDESNGKLDKI